MLRPEHFAEYFQLANGVPPFPWQVRLLHQVHEHGEFPRALDLPTGTGKTSVIDIALFAQALDAARPPAERRCPRRIAFVVDRRTVVDQAYERAQRLLNKLSEVTEGTLKHVADALRELGGEASPFHTALLRGAIPREDVWARSPTQPSVLVSTVDQVGSRLLFRGYGVSPTMRPVHAGLLGNDLLLFLDEVHLSQAFAQTLEQLEQTLCGRVGGGLPRRFQFVSLSATHREGGSDPFRLETEDRVHPLLSARLQAKKPVELHEVRVTGDEADKLSLLTAGLEKLVKAHARTTTAVVVNRVAAARELHARLQEQHAAGTFAPEVVLLTGRMRPLDRQALERSLKPRIAAGRERQSTSSPLVVIATQCIEAGADFDFDVMISECASWDALKQRFGRLNRLGSIDDARGFIVARSDATKQPDPVYGSSLGNTWKFLSSLPRVDFGLNEVPTPSPEQLAELVTPVVNAPVLLPSHLEAWTCTLPAPEPDPDPAFWLHGNETSPPDIQVVWRVDVTEEALSDETEREAVLTRIGACPPLSSEALQVDLIAFRRWCAGERAFDVELSDVEHGIVDEGERRSQRASRLVLLYRGENSEIVDGNDIGPGSTVVVPASFGGLRAGNWDPRSVEPVPDLAERAHFAQRGRALLRLHRTVLRQVLGVPDPEPLLDAVNSEQAGTRWAQELLEALEARVPSHDAELRPVLSALRHAAESPRGLRTHRASSSQPVEVVEARRAVGVARDAPTTEDDGSFLVGVEVPLDAHLIGVGDFARRFAVSLGLSDGLIGDLELAGRLHDLGKADARFQLLLHGGSEFRLATARCLLAKSNIPFSDRRARQAARERSGYLGGTRHELVSLAMLESSPALKEQAHDLDLVRHLVASHHGYCRPLAPVEPQMPDQIVEHIWDGERLHAPSRHGLARIDAGLAERFELLSQRYGHHGLAWLEAILRLADHRRSEAEQLGAT